MWIEQAKQIVYHYKREETMDRKKMIERLLEWFKKDSMIYNMHNPLPLENFKLRLNKMTDDEIKFEHEVWKASNPSVGIFN
jgi:hypothetical protein